MRNHKSVQQKAILVAIGLQHRNVDDLAKVRLVPKLDPMPASQMLGHFKRAIIKINEELKSLQRVSHNLYDINYTIQFI